MKRMKVGLLLAGALLLVLASCGSTPKAQQGRGMPAEIRDWTQKNDGTIYGIGISEEQKESDALRQATARAKEDLAGNLSTDVAVKIEDFARSSSNTTDENEKKQRIAQFEAATKQIVAATIENAKTVGPYINGMGNTYVLKYLDKKALDDLNTDLDSYVKSAFKDTSNELDQMLKK